ncbi:membrane hypothetical protein [Vibrio chagasii]|nr:membrane hypothetical protein [Vibrio chagasii]
MDFILQLLFGLSLLSLIGYIQFQAAVYALRKTNFFKYRYRDQCEAALFKVMFLVVVPLTIVIITLLNLYFTSSMGFILGGIGSSTITFLIALMGIYDRNIVKRFKGYYVTRDGKTLMTRDVVSEPTEEELAILASGKKINSKSCEQHVDSTRI